MKARLLNGMVEYGAEAFDKGDVPRAIYTDAHGDFCLWDGLAFLWFADLSRMTANHIGPDFFPMQLLPVGTEIALEQE